MFYNIIFFFKEFKNFLIGILNQIELLIKENKEAEFKIFTNRIKNFLKIRQFFQSWARRNFGYLYCR